MGGGIFTALLNLLGMGGGSAAPAEEGGLLCADLEVTPVYDATLEVTPVFNGTLEIGRCDGVGAQAAALGVMLYEDGTPMLYEDGTVMLYESGTVFSE